MAFVLTGYLVVGCKAHTAHCPSLLGKVTASEFPSPGSVPTGLAWLPSRPQPRCESTETRFSSMGIRYGLLYHSGSIYCGLVDMSSQGTMLWPFPIGCQPLGHRVLLVTPLSPGPIPGSGHRKHRRKKKPYVLGLIVSGSVRESESSCNTGDNVKSMESLVT